MYAPEETFIDRLGQYFKEMGLSAMQPIKSTVTRLSTLMPSPAHNLGTHIYFVLSVPGTHTFFLASVLWCDSCPRTDSSGAPVLPGFESDEESDEEESELEMLGGITLLEASDATCAYRTS